MPFVEFEVTADHINDGQNPKNEDLRVYSCPISRAIQVKIKNKAYASFAHLVIYLPQKRKFKGQDTRHTIAWPQNIVDYIRRADVQHAAAVNNRPLESWNILAEPLQPMQFKVQIPENIYQYLEFHNDKSTA